MTELLKDLIPIPEHVHKGDFVLKLTEGVTDERAQATLQHYVVTPQLVECFDACLRLIHSALEPPPPTSKAAYLHGSFGSGKSHFMAVLHLLLQHHPAARAVAKLQPLLARHERWLAGKKFLLVPYHMIDARSLESAVLGGYVEHVQRLHPQAPLPAVYRADDLLRDARRMHQNMGDHAFFAALNTAREGGGAGDDGWGDMAVTWDAARFEDALRAPPRSELRGELISDLIQTHFTGYKALAAGEGEQLVDLDEGLAAISQHAKRLGYDGLILFLDELVLWLATRMADSAFVTREGNKVVKLVEATRAERPIPIVSFVARQRDLRELVGESTPGAEHLAFADVLRHWEGRFGVITLEDRNLPAIAAERVLRPRDEGARQRIDAAFQASTRVRKEVLEVLSTREGDQELFRQVYPFSPAFVQTLVAVSSALQRERTALKMLAIYLQAHRESLELGQLVPVGDLFDLISEGDEPFSSELRLHFENAKRLYVQRLLPMLERQHGLRQVDAQAQPRDPKSLALENDARLLKTLLLAALVPEVESLKGLTPVRLAALNHGTIRSPIPGQEAGLVLRKVRQWAGEVGEIRVSDDPTNPTLGLQVTGVDTEAILEKARVHDNAGNRRRAMKRLIFKQLGLPEGDQVYLRHDLVWKGTARQVDVVFDNVREMVADALRAKDDVWKVVIDFPFDEAGHSPLDDLGRVRAFAEQNDATRTLVWLPDFLGPEALRDLGKLVILEFVLAGTGERFEQYASHLSPTERQAARLILENQETQLRQSLIGVLDGAYGIAGAQRSRLDPTHRLDDHVYSLWDGFNPGTPVGADLRQAFRHLVAQSLAHQFPGHPDFSAEKDPDDAVRPSEVKKVAAEVVRVAEEGDQGRLEIGEKKHRPLLRRIAQPLGLGTMHEVAFELEHFWPQHLDRCQAQAKSRNEPAELTVRQIRAWTDQPEPRGLPAWAQDLIVLTVAAQTQRALYHHGNPVASPEIGRLEDDMVLLDTQLPSDSVWQTARERAAALLGLAPSPLKNARNVTQLVQDLPEKLAALREPARELVKRLAATARDLGVGDQADRLRAAQVALGLLERVVEAEPRAALVTFAEADLGGKTAEVLGTSLKQARAVVEALQTTNWELLQAVFALKDPARADAAGALRQRLAEALSRDELVESLPPALREVSSKAVKLLAAGAPASTPPAPAPAPAAQVVVVPVAPALETFPRPPADQLVSAGESRAIDLRAARELFQRLEGELKKRPQARLSLVWRIEKSDQT